VCPGVSECSALSAPFQACSSKTIHPMLRVLKLTARQGTPMRAHFRPPQGRTSGASRRDSGGSREGGGALQRHAPPEALRRVPGSTTRGLRPKAGFLRGRGPRRPREVRGALAPRDLGNEEPRAVRSPIPYPRHLDTHGHSAYPLQPTENYEDLERRGIHRLTKGDPEKRSP
jgi:hypothetical protein